VSCHNRRILILIVPNRPRFPPRGFEDPPASEVEPTWYRHVPPPSVREAIEAQGISWDEAVKELAARRDAMVEGEEWDISYENGKLTWKKPSEATIKERYESQIDLREWGLGWRKVVVWTIWKMLGSPEGVFEYEGGKLDGKLVLRELAKEKKGGLKELEKKEEKP
jgi:hypothetical protein